MKEIKNKDIGFNNQSMLTDLSLHSEEIKKNLENVNMEPWYYIYENFVNPELRKQKYKENSKHYKNTTELSSCTDEIADLVNVN